MLTLARFHQLIDTFRGLRIAVLGDFCLDRYLEIDFRRQEISLETGLPVWNVERVRPQPGGCGTIVNNLVALGAGTILPIGFCGQDGEGWELRDRLGALTGVDLQHFHTTPLRKTFTYTKPLALAPVGPPQELNRIDIKNWTPTPASLSACLSQSIESLVGGTLEAMIVLDQCDLPNVGVVTDPVLETVRQVAERYRQLVIVSDSRSGLKRFPPVTWKMNRHELQTLLESHRALTDPQETQQAAVSLARRNGAAVCVTMAEAGIVASSADGEAWHVPGLPVEGPIDVVGAGDAVTATFTLTRAAGGTLLEALQMAVLAGHVVVHQLGTTGTAQPALMEAALRQRGNA